MTWPPRRKGNLYKLSQRLNLNTAAGQPDYILLGVIAFILLFGLVMLSSASSIQSYRQFGSAYTILFRQIFKGVLPGLLVFFFFLKIDYRFWQRYLTTYLVLILGLLIAVFLPLIGASYGRAHSWVDLGFISFQPTEIVKLLLVLFLANWFSQRRLELTQDFWNGLLPLAGLIVLISLLIILQPDFGTLMVVVAIAISVYFTAGGRWKHILLLAGAGLGGLAGLIVMAPYRAARLLTFINPGLDPQGTGYQISQALLAVGSGGWLGLGLGQSVQKFAYLPEVMGDSIFAIIAEEVGFIFSCFLIIAFITILLRSLKIAQTTKDDYARYIVVGIVAWFACQAFFNIGAMLRLLPLTGLPLPFVSYGGTAMIASLAAVGLLANISSQKN